MNFEYKHLIPADFAADSRVWIYQGNRAFTDAEAVAINETLDAFAGDWKSHGAAVKGFGRLLFNQFIVLLADETASGVSGCSTDSSVRLIKQIEQDYKTPLFDRQLLAFVVKDAVQLLPLSQLKSSVENNFINAETLYFNNIVPTKQALLDDWIVPVKDSWLAKKLPALAGQAV